MSHHDSRNLPSKQAASLDANAADVKGLREAVNVPGGSSITGQPSPIALEEFLMSTSPMESHLTREVPPVLATSLSSRTAFLLRTYENGIGTWMDVFDSSMSYQRGLLQLLPQSPLLLNSTCALAARQLSLIGDAQIWTSVAEMHYGESLSMLRSSIERSTANDEHALIASILLSSYELLAFPGQDYHRHFRGAKSFVEALGARHSAKRMIRASFWIYARHEVGQAMNLEAMLMQDPITWPKMDSLALGDVGEDAYCNDALRLCAEVVHFVFGANSRKMQAKRWARQWLSLRVEWKNWHRDCPKDLFGMEYVDPGSRRRYWFPRSSLASALCFYHVSQIFLLSRLPQIPLLRTDSSSVFDAANSVQDHVETLIDIALSDMPDSVQVTMVQPLFHAARHVRDITRRAEAITLLEDIQRRTGFHTKAKVDILRQLA
jgi:hypothetical protein